MSGHEVKLRLTPSISRFSWERLDELFFGNKIVLFSGGLDSLCGALSFSKSFNVILSHCITNQVVFNRVLKQSNMASLRKTLLYCSNARTRLTTGGISETRGLLFLSSAYAVAASLGLRSVAYCENGSQMLDVMLGSLTYPNKQATKNTNLIYVEKIEDIFANFDSKVFTIELPFKDVTRAEMLAPFKNAIPFEDTFSCFTTRFRTGMCGICYNCFVRRTSLQAIGAREGGNVYEMNPFRDELSEKKSHSDTMDILFHLLRFYSKILAEDTSALDEIRMNSRQYFADPIGLATRFAEDIFVGVMKMLQQIDERQLNALGKKAKELLSKIDKATLTERAEELAKRC